MHFVHSSAAPQSSNGDRVQAELFRQMLTNERTRAGILAVGIAAFLCAMSVVQLILPGMPQRLFGKAYRFAVILAIFGPAMLGEAALWGILGHSVKKGLRPPPGGRYCNAIFEITLPSVTIFYIGTLGHPIYALLGPSVFIYFLLIMLSTLRLDFRICAFTGFIAAAQYAGLAYYSLREAKTAHLLLDTLLVAPVHHVEKTVMIFLSGLLAGLITRQIRHHVSAAVHTVQERERIIELFGRHVSPSVVEKLLAQPNAEGERRQVCVMFLDIRNFTSFSEGRQPEEVVRFLNRIFEPLIDCVNRHHGIINKFLGDGFMAVFGAPLVDSDAAGNAVRASRDVLSAVQKLMDDGQIPPTRIGIGLHLGEAVTGNVGSPQRKEYTIIGDVVNVAARIEGLNKQFGSQFLVSESVRAQAMAELEGAIACGPVPVKGRSDVVTVFQAG